METIQDTEANKGRKKNNLTEGKLLPALLRFSLPFLLSSFLQTFYGLADLFITGQFNGADTITAVSVGSQITHMITVIIVGLSMGTTVMVGQAIGAGQKERIAKVIGNSITLFLSFSVVLMAILMVLINQVIAALSTPVEAVSQTRDYIFVCLIGIPFIMAYNVISSIYRGMGDSKTPMYFVAFAGVINIFLDYLLIGSFRMGARGAAIATVSAQALSVLLALLAISRNKSIGTIKGSDLILRENICVAVIKIGVPIALQDGLIQISFLVITAIANSRGVQVAAAVGIVEKLICFFFLVPSAMLSSVSAIAAQNAGAGQNDRSRKALWYGICICLGFGAVVSILCQFLSGVLVGLFTDETEVVRLGTEYLRTYIFDCALAGVHFCFSGFFCAYGKSTISFIHNMLSVLLVRIPGAYYASVLYPDSLYQMGMAPPAGSFLSILICLAFFLALNRSGGFVAQVQEGGE